ncbi:MAG: hypothetical protein CL565_03770 [Alphaproteobacteria bacterium]|nr:hypothetical protein [Alphaproteobacteria bacterium]|tara:strand:+ start:87 stop:983 length:897 start_codon:yes stop_codon:yes gene_type:complete
MTQQSTRHILLIEPAEFYRNPQTADTNVYQHDEDEGHLETFQKALQEFRNFRNVLVEHGIHITTLKGSKGCPDHIFPNWASTDPEGRLVFYPMLNENRQAERTPEMLDFFKKYYALAADFRDEEKNGRYLESTGSLVIDHVHKRAYCALSGRSTESLAKDWADKLGYKLYTFPTLTHTGKPVYHTDLTMFIGTEFAAICAECITDEKKRDEVVASLKEHREVVFLSKEQLANFCGNSLEVKGDSKKPYLVMSANGQSHLTNEQVTFFKRYVTDIIGSDISTIEKYGGGSARCLLLELH